MRSEGYCTTAFRYRNARNGVFLNRISCPPANIFFKKKSKNFSSYIYKKKKIGQYGGIDPFQFNLITSSVDFSLKKNQGNIKS